MPFSAVPIFPYSILYARRAVKIHSFAEKGRRFADLSARGRSGAFARLAKNPREKVYFLKKRVIMVVSGIKKDRDRKLSNCFIRRYKPWQTSEKHLQTTKKCFASWKRAHSSASPIRSCGSTAAPPQRDALRAEACATGEMIKLNEDLLPECYPAPHGSQRRRARGRQDLHLLQKQGRRRPPSTTGWTRRKPIKWRARSSKAP